MNCVVVVVVTRTVHPGSVEDPLSGIPLFWLHAMLNCDTLSSIIQSYDRPVLKYLIDVRVVQDISDHLDFRLEFMFAPNAFFDNTVLTKTYQVSLSFSLL